MHCLAMSQFPFCLIFHFILIAGMLWHARVAEGLDHNKKGSVLGWSFEISPSTELRNEYVLLVLPVPQSPPLILTSRIPRIKHRTQTSPPSFPTVFGFCPNGFLVCSYLEFSPAFLFIWKLSFFWHKCLPLILFWGRDHLPFWEVNGV